MEDLKSSMPEGAFTRAAVTVAGVQRPSAFEPVFNPARTSEAVGEVAVGTADHVDEAVRAADAAFRSWSRTAPDKRAGLLAAAATSIRRHIPEIAELLTREQGKVLWESRLDVGGAAHILDWYAGLSGDLFEDQVFKQDDHNTIYRGRRSMGVTGVIVPWNSPIHLAFLGIGPALLAGNTVVVKPSEFAPLALARVLELAAAELPEGVVNVVPGVAEAGAAIAAHPRIRKLFFTGSTATGRSVMRDAASNLKHVSLELGGNDPAIVLESARVDDNLVNELIQGVFTLSGQICFGVKRIYVHESHYEDFVDRYVAAADELVVGDGLEPTVTMGPLNNRPQFDRVQKLLADTRSSGADVRTVGRKFAPDTWDEGLFILPNVVTGLPADADLVTCEQFGPVIPILPFARESEVIELANSTEFGLSASVWSEDRAHAHEVARELECGSVFLNVHRVGASDVSMPFGGFKSSGVGRGHGMAALDASTETQMIADYTDVSRLPSPERI
jgi:aldehyde dehydrogenase